MQRRIKASGKKVEVEVEVQVCHPGASRTNLLKDTASTFNKIVWAVFSRVIAQSAEKGSWPEVMCATEEGLENEKLYGPTKRSETVGPVGECVLGKCALDQAMATQLWKISKEKTSCPWSL